MERFVEPTEIIGSSPCITELRNTLRELAKTDATVLIEGETGTGKDVAARFLYQCDPAPGLFVHIDCGALQETLLASELFGHERGAFTGAVQDKRGLIEIADGGTLFLDEIGELGLLQQRQLLTTIEQKRIRRIGGLKHTSVAFRLIAATNRDLRTEVNHGRFREDLFYRLNVVKIRVPALRERCEDIPLLVEHFLKKWNRDPLQDSCVSQLSSYSWPGNVRQLKSCIERMIVLSGGQTPTAKHFPTTIQMALGVAPTHQAAQVLSQGAAIREHAAPGAERARLVAALEESAGNLSKAAQLLGIGRTTLYRRMSKQNLSLCRTPHSE